MEWREEREHGARERRGKDWARKGGGVREWGHGEERRGHGK